MGGRAPTACGTWNPFTTSYAAPTKGQIALWYAGNPPSQPLQNWNAALYKNTSATAQVGHGGDPSYDFRGYRATYFHPGMVVSYSPAFGGASLSGARWTAAVAGNVTVSARFSMQCDIVEGWGGHGGPNPNDWTPATVAIALNSNSIAGTTLNGFAGNVLTTDGPYGSPVFTWTGTVTVAAGDTLDFGSGKEMPVGMSVTITTQDVPEPSSLFGFAVFASGMGLTAMRKLRRK